jgi:hypothetical protein
MMKKRIYILGFNFFCALFVYFMICPVQAKAELNRYLYPYEISELDWQLLQWTSAWHDSQDQFAPFKFERVEYTRKVKKIMVYLTGLIADGTKNNLNLSLQKLNKVFTLRFSYFDAKKDLQVFYRLLSQDKTKAVNIEYNDGMFSSEDLNL